MIDQLSLNARSADRTLAGADLGKPKAQSVTVNSAVKAVKHPLPEAFKPMHIIDKSNQSV